LILPYIFQNRYDVQFDIVNNLLFFDELNEQISIELVVLFNGLQLVASQQFNKHVDALNHSDTSPQLLKLIMRVEFELIHKFKIQ